MPVGKSEQLPIVVVDDQITMRKALVRIFEKTGQYQIEEFGNASEAINWLKSHRVELIITDIYMPSGDGFDLLNYVRGRAMQNDIPVLFISGEATKEDIVRSADLGVSDYILKPFDAQDIILKVNSIIKKYKNPPENIKKLRHAETLFFNEKYQDAKTEFEMILSSGKPSARSLIGLAQTESKLKNISKAMEYVNQAIEINNMYYPAYAVGADILIANKKKNEAVDFLENELRINGKQINRRIILADIYLEQINIPGNQEKAIEHLKSALQDAPTNEILLLRYADILWKLGNKEKAVHYCMKARRQNPESIKSMMQLANMYIQANQSLKGISFFTDLLKKNQNQFDLYLCRARIYEKLNDTEMAITDLNKIPITLARLRLDVLKAKGRIYAKINKIPDAIAACEGVANMEPTADNLARVGLLFIRLKNYNNALGWYAQAVLMDPRHVNYIYNLGCCYEALQNSQKAIECYEKSLKLDPMATQIKTALARVKKNGLTPKVPNIPNTKETQQTEIKSTPPKAS